MKKVSEIFSDLKPYNTDPRRRDYIVPKRIVWSQGCISGAENLLIPKESQILLSDKKLCVLKNKDGIRSSILLDFGREIHGSARIYVHSLTGKSLSLRIRFGESAMEAMTELGVQNTTNNHANRDMIMTVEMFSANETNESGFRFMRIDLLDEDTEISLKAIEGVFIYRDVDYIGSFECDDALVNEIFNTAAYTVHLNMQEHLWDGIKRDRLTWIGDMQTEVLTILSVFGYNEVVPRSLDLMRDTTPIGKWMNDIMSYSIWWLFLHYEWYMSLGDLEYLREQQAYMTSLLELLCTQVREDSTENFDSPFLDWSTRNNPEAARAGMHAMLVMAMQKGQVLMDILGNPELVRKCRETEAKLRTYVSDPNGSKQAGALLVCAGISDAKVMTENLLCVNGAAGFSAFLGYYTLSAIAASGDHRCALDCMREYWGTMLKMGATTFWEEFDIAWAKNASPITELVPIGKDDIHGNFGEHCYVNFRRSLCHGWASGPVPFLLQSIAGIQILEPGTRKVRIRPNLGDLYYIRCTYPTPYGEIKIYACKAENGELQVDVQAPDEVVIEK
ncbi:MAG: alpha-L-rhamnosidase [Clostridia bacterium]|nr:alpha-L-rhamnosidase [Clostridia bacterium]